MCCLNEKPGLLFFCPYPCLFVCLFVCLNLYSEVLATGPMVFQHQLDEFDFLAMFHVKNHMMPGQVSCSFRRTTFGLVKQGVQAGLPEVYLEDLGTYQPSATRQKRIFIDVSTCWFACIFWPWIRCDQLIDLWIQLKICKLGIFVSVPFFLNWHIYTYCFQVVRKVSVWHCYNTRWLFFHRKTQMMSGTHNFFQQILWTLSEVLIPWMLRVQTNLGFV